MRIVFITLLIMLSQHAFSQIRQFSLDNGLNIVVQEDHRAPIVVSMIWYNVGSADEQGGRTGLSHALEHLMFKGTPSFPLGMFSKIIAQNGGQMNAFTNNDYTAFYEKTAAIHLAKNLELEADRMQNLLLDKDEFHKELKVIQEERRLRTDDDPQAITFERFLAAAHLSSPYHHPVIGWMSDLKQMTVDDIKEWYQTYYAPNNATLVVVGDVNTNEVYLLAKKYFSKLKRQAIPQRKKHTEPPYLGKKTIQVRVNAQLPLLIMGYSVPTVSTVSPDKLYIPYALEIIAEILDAGDSARFTKTLIREKNVASNMDTFYNLYARYQTQFVIHGTPAHLKSIDDLRYAILGELKHLTTELVDEAELKRIKTQIVAQKIFQRDSIFNQAMELGLLETVGLGWQTTEKYIERINNITPEQIQKTAKEYFNEQQLTEAELIPTTATTRP
ncbi:MAG: M16 family metallopeptidase [Legionella sp.]